jgi:hypothetical protein
MTDAEQLACQTGLDEISPTSGGVELARDVCGVAWDTLGYVRAVYLTAAKVAMAERGAAMGIASDSER